MVKERYCSFEVAKLLKEKGFNVGISTYYYSTSEYTKNVMYRSWKHNINWNNDEYYYSAPTHQMAMDWLREKGFHIEIYANASGYKFIISKPGGDGTDLVCDIQGTNDGGAWNDYGGCVESAIDYCLTKLI